jgi:hypothetical protein
MKSRTVLTASFFLMTAFSAPLRADAPRQTEIVFDASRSMNDPLGADTKLEAAKQSLTGIAGQIAPGSLVGLRVFGASPVGDNVRQSCFDSQLVMPIGPPSKSAMIAKVMALQAFGQTALGYSLELAAKDFDSAPEVSKTIILISDGQESCGKDPVTVMKNLKAQGIDVKVHAIGFGVDEPTKAQLQEIAQMTQGSYQDAQDAQSLKQSLESVAHQEKITAPAAPKAAAPENPAEEANPEMLLQAQRVKGENLLAAAAGARIVTASNQDVALAMDGSEDTVASLGSGDYAVLSFKDNQPALLDSFSVPIFEQSSSNPKKIELSASAENAQTGFVPLLSIEVPNKVDFKNVYQEFKIDPPAPVRFLKIRIGEGRSGNYSDFAEWKVSGKLLTEDEFKAELAKQPAKEVDVIAKDAGGTIAASSQQGFEALIDGAPGNQAGGENVSIDAGSEVVFAFDGGREAYLMRAAVPVYEAAPENCKTLEVSVSPDSASENFHSAGTFQTTNMLMNGKPEQEFKFPAPVKAKFVKVKFIDDHGSGGTCELGELEIFGSFQPVTGAVDAASLPQAASAPAEASETTEAAEEPQAEAAPAAEASAETPAAVDNAAAPEDSGTVMENPPSDGIEEEAAPPPAQEDKDFEQESKPAGN